MLYKFNVYTVYTSFSNGNIFYIYIQNSLMKVDVYL